MKTSWPQKLVLLFYGTLVALNVLVTDGELVEKNIIEVISMLDPSNSKLQQIAISSPTTEKHIFQTLAKECRTNLSVWPKINPHI
jgi:hypothetical protein